MQTFQQLFFQCVQFVGYVQKTICAIGFPQNINTQATLRIKNKCCPNKIDVTLT